MDAAKSADEQFEGFLARFTPEIAAQTKAAMAILRRRLPGAVELVYDNYNALVIGYGPDERAGHALFSIALYPRWINFFFLNGKGLPDPERLLKGSGNVVRHIVLTSPEVLLVPAVAELMEAALERAEVPYPKGGKRRMVIKAVAPKQRSRRPAKGKS